MSTSTTPQLSGPEPSASGGVFSTAVREIMASSPMRVLLSILLGFLAGAIILVFTDPDVAAASAYFFARPGDTLIAAWDVVSRGYGALLEGSIWDPAGANLIEQSAPLVASLNRAAPLIVAGLGIALSFRTGMFNIGGQGQVLFGAAFAAFISFQVHLPAGIHLIVAILFGVLGAGLLGAFVGFLKAKTGAHEVIVTIMLNYIAYNFVTYLMRTPVLQDPEAGGTPKTVAPDATAQYPLIFGDSVALNLGILIAVIATVAYWWIMERSSMGFRFRAVGFNPNAARSAGISVARTYVLAMTFSALFVGLAGANQALARSTGFMNTIDSGIGFDAITVALLGGSTPWGIFIAGVFFGAMKAGSSTMQAAGVAPEILTIVQGLIVLFIAAPPLVRAIFRLPSGHARQRRRQKSSHVEKAEVSA